MKRSLQSLSVLLALLSASSAPASDWPQWRGPNRDGRSADVGLLKRWPDTGPFELVFADVAPLPVPTP